MTQIVKTPNTCEISTEKKCHFVGPYILNLLALEGGAKKQSGRHHPPTLKSSLRASQICYYFLQGGLGKKVMRCQSLRGGGGGGLCLK